MSAFEPRIVLRPRSLDETFDLALAYARNFRREFLRPYLLLVLGPLGLLWLLEILLELSFGPIWFGAMCASTLGERLTLVYVGRQHLFGHAPSLTAAARTLGSRPWLTIFAAPLTWFPILPYVLFGMEDVWLGLALGLGCTLWPLVLSHFSFLMPALLLEELPSRAAVRRAATLNGHRLGRSLAFLAVSGTMRLVLVLLCDLLAQFLLEFVFQLGAPRHTLQTTRGSWAGVTGLLAAGPLIALTRLFDYIDARTRIEGWDIQVRFKAIVARARSRDRFTA